MLLQANLTQVNIIILEVYASAADKPEEQVMEFYLSISNTIMENTPRQGLRNTVN